MILPCEIPQLGIPDVGRNHILLFFLVPVRKIIQYKRFIQTACLSLPLSQQKTFKIISR